ncbi:hypothetical protein STAQ_11610 [Allostella sp. ATCC 35155]|nr:hypothetical protein STAQ_11610 [Stella sp. ATCC 35155]
MSAAFAAALDGMAAALGRLAPDAVERAAVAARDAAAARSPVRSGRLRDGWRIEAAGEGARVVNAVPYAAAVEYGSRGRPGRPMARPAAQVAAQAAADTVPP